MDWINHINNDDLLKIDFFQDFLSFLKYLSNKPIQKTATGNISRADIGALSDIFRNGQRLKFMDEEMRWPIRSESEVPYLTQIKIIAEVMHLTYNRKKELRISGNGKAFFTNLEPKIQYRNMVFAYWDQVNWGYFSARDTNVSIFQKNLAYILKYFASRGSDWIEFTPFCRSLKDNFKLENHYSREYGDPDFDIKLDIRYDLIERNLKLFGCVETELTEETEDNWRMTEIRRFRSTDIGLWLYYQYLQLSISLKSV